MPQKNLTYQAMRAELDEVLADFQRDDIDVEAATKQYERGLELIKSLEAQLKKAENTVTKLRAKPGADEPKS